MPDASTRPPYRRGQLVWARHVDGERRAMTGVQLDKQDDWSFDGLLSKAERTAVAQDQPPAATNEGESPLPVDEKSTTDLGRSPTTAAVQAAARAAAKPSAVPPPLVNGPTEAELELADLRQKLAEAQAQLVSTAASEAGGLRHESFCLPRPGDAMPRLEQVVHDRIDPQTSKTLGSVTLLRCLECGVQRETSRS